MKLTELISPDAIRLGLTASDKSEVLRALSSLLAQAHVGVDSADALGTLSRREVIQTTGMGEGVAIPHAKLAGLRRVALVLAIAPEGVDFEAMDGEPVRLFFAFLSPADGAAEQHLKLLARIVRLCRTAPLHRRMLAATGVEEVMRVLADADAAAEGAAA